MPKRVPARGVLMVQVMEAAEALLPPFTAREVAARAEWLTPGNVSAGIQSLRRKGLLEYAGGSGRMTRYQFAEDPKGPPAPCVRLRALLLTANTMGACVDVDLDEVNPYTVRIPGQRLRRCATIKDAVDELFSHGRLA